MERAVVIVSGGIDSSVLLYDTLNKGFTVNCLTFLYGQKHRREVDSAVYICNLKGVPHKLIDLSSLKTVFSGSALTDDNVSIPEVNGITGSFNTLKTTIVPNRNSIFLSIAIGFAYSIGADTVFFGAHHSDRGVYPDCRKEFVQAFEIAERLANDRPSMSVKAPFIDLEKSEIVRLGSRLNIPFEKTWSCYKGGSEHCGSCSSCSERKRAFLESGIEDPTVYSL